MGGVGMSGKWGQRSLIALGITLLGGIVYFAKPAIFQDTVNFEGVATFESTSTFEEESTLEKSAVLKDVVSKPAAPAAGYKKVYNKGGVIYTLDELDAELSLEFGGVGYTSEIRDADNDTKIEVEQSADEDKIRATVAGTQEVLIDVNGLALKTGADVNEISTETTWAAPTDDQLATKLASKTYIGTAITPFSPLEDGTADGQIAFWDTAGWLHTEVTELFWDDAAKSLDINALEFITNIITNKVASGAVTIQGAAADGGSNGGATTLVGGEDLTGSNNGGKSCAIGGRTELGGNGGQAVLGGGASESGAGASGDGGPATIYGGDSDDGNGGDVNIDPGTAGSASNGDITLGAGAAPDAGFGFGRGATAWLDILNSKAETTTLLLENNNVTPQDVRFQAKSTAGNSAWFEMRSNGIAHFGKNGDASGIMVFFGGASDESLVFKSGGIHLNEDNSNVDTFIDTDTLEGFFTIDAGLNELQIDGGYGSTGFTIDVGGNVTTNGTILTDGSLTSDTGVIGGGFGSTGSTLSSAGDFSFNGLFTQNYSTINTVVQSVTVASTPIFTLETIADRTSIATIQSDLTSQLSFKSDFDGTPKSAFIRLSEAGVLEGTNLGGSLIWTSSSQVQFIAAAAIQFKGTASALSLEISAAGDFDFQDGNMTTIGTLNADGETTLGGGYGSTGVTADASGNLSLNGNIVVDGTVDGRDVATDGSKLDLIEALADVTDATNVDAAGATMNADADLSTTSWFLDEDDMVSNSAVKTSSQQSTKAFVDAEVLAIDFWDRAATTLSPKTANDNIDIGSGNYLTSGNVDGRDVSVDGSKLDLIEALADVTDSTNVNAAGATMNADTTIAGNGWFLDDDAFTADDATKAASQQSIAAYIASEIAAIPEIIGGMYVRGNASQTTITVQGLDQPFTAVSDGGGGEITLTMADTTGISALDVVWLSNTEYAGKYTVQSVIVNTSINLTAVFGSTAAGDVQKGWVKVVGTTIETLITDNVSMSGDNTLTFSNAVAENVHIQAIFSVKLSGSPADDVEFCLMEDDDILCMSIVPRSVSTLLLQGSCQGLTNAISSDTVSLYTRNMDGTSKHPILENFSVGLAK